MKSVLALVTAALALSASSAFAQPQPASASAAQPAQNAKIAEMDAKAYPAFKASILETIDARIKILQDDRKCVVATADGKALDACMKASKEAQRAMVEKLRRAQGAPAPAGATSEVRR